MNAARVIEPEWLDELPHEDPRARRSRRDLARVNALMGNVRIVAGALARLPALASVAEIGAGDGAFMRAVLARVDGPPAQVHLVDRQPLGTVTADVFDWLADPPAARVDAIVANLFLHHFVAADVERMMALIARRARVFVACEPRRSFVALAGSHLLGLVGCNDVTRHDAVVSVRAGFSGGELSALWGAKDGWAVEERGRGLFSHVFVARRHD